MRRFHVSALAVLAALCVMAPLSQAFAQEDDQRRQRLDYEMQTQALPMPESQAAGPCPFVKVLYDAARDIEFKDGQQASSAVVYSAEIQGLTSACAYKGDEPIRVNMVITFAVGRGPQATGAGKTYNYWIAVTDRNKTVLAKEYFTIVANFAPDMDRGLLFDRVENIVIPRANAGVSGSNFEILVGFELPPEMVTFNRSGSRFRINATGAATAAAAPPATPGAPTAQ